MGLERWEWGEWRGLDVEVGDGGRVILEGVDFVVVVGVREWNREVGWLGREERGRR